MGRSVINLDDKDRQAATRGQSGSRRSEPFSPLGALRAWQDVLLPLLLLLVLSFWAFATR